ncbi:MAG: hypothetical protein Q8N21_01870 [bacterium]|nr:hypothetical protein [bacterium]
MTDKKTTTQKDPSSSANAAADKDIEANKTIAALSYVWILFLVPLLGKRDSKFAQFHAKQGLVLFIIEIIVGLVMWFPIIGQLLMLALIVIAVMGIIKVLNGEWWKIPYIYNWSKKINL